MTPQAKDFPYPLRRKIVRRDTQKSSNPEIHIGFDRLLRIEMLNCNSK